MTEIPDEPVGEMPAPIQRFIGQWGSMGASWGVNRSVSQVHALLYVSEPPLTAEDIAAQLGMARSNVSTSLKELLAWDLIRRVPILSDRRDFFAAETDVWNIVTRIAAGRKLRELDPAAAALRECIVAAEADGDVSRVATERLRDMLEFVERTTRWYDQMLALPRAQIVALMKLGGGVVRVLGRSARSSNVRVVGR
jgi:DNA-binding transcriptional regulator GbsR (MarR family)